MGEKSASSTNVPGKSGYLPAKKLKFDPCLSPCISILYSSLEFYCAVKEIEAQRDFVTCLRL
jgi:hypothetical protein